MKRLPRIALVLFAPLLAGCGALDVLDPCPSGLVCVDGQAQFFSFEGGFWAIRGDDDVTYDPLGTLPADFRQSGLRVHLQARVRDDIGSFHMAGPVVDVISIRKLK